jgi:hypothetical protein
VHKGFMGFRAVSHALISGGNLIDLKSEIPYALYTKRCSSSDREIRLKTH